MSQAPLDRLTALDLDLWRKRGLRLLVTLVVLALLGYAGLAAVSVRTTWEWFASVRQSSVYATVVTSQILLFVVAAAVMAAAVAVSLVVTSRVTPAFVPDPERQRRRARFLEWEPRLRWWLVALVAGALGLSQGQRAAGAWQSYLLWRHAAPWGQTDPLFHRDLSYFVMELPFQQLVVGWLLRTVVWAMVVTVIAGYAYGAWKVREVRPRVAPGFLALLSAQAGCLALVLTLRFVLDRYAVTTSSRGPVTGASYTDLHAVLPGRTALVYVAVVAAGLLWANVVVRSRRLAVGVGVAAGLAVVALAVVWPMVVMRFREQPSEGALDRTTIARNQRATMTAYGLAGHVRTTTLQPGRHDGKPLLDSPAGRTTQIRVLDPNRLSPTFNVKRQLQSYYGFKSTLDIDRYPVGGRSRDVAIAVRELRVNRIPRTTWGNQHLVYTHGYGVVAAPTDTMAAETGTPRFFPDGPPPGATLDRPQVYYSPSSPSYSVVGQPAGSDQQLEFDYPGAGNQAHHTTYQGPGVPVGSLLDRALWAIRLRSPNLVFSSEINPASTLLTVRNPRARVAQLAPWLTLDGDTYPVVSGGRLLWVVDGYTAANSYPYSQQLDLGSTTSSTLTRSGSTVRQPGVSVNYLRNSVKATVDAYTGEVTLYAWDQADRPDPILQTWESAFPGLVQPEDSIPAALLPHLRYPQDLFHVQRSLLTKYHVTDPGDFYNGGDFWKVPTDPTVAATNRLNAQPTPAPGTTTTKPSTPTQPAAYLSLSADGTSPAHFALSSPLVTLNRRTLAAFLSVDATPGPGYGDFTLVEVPPDRSIGAPAQIQNDIESSTTISEALTLQRGGNSKVVLGNLQAVPVDGQILYVEPVYTQAAGGNSFPILRHVIAVYGDGPPAFEPTLRKALTAAGGTG